MAIIKREFGKEQPYIPAGIFKIRLPFIHYKWEKSEMLQAVLMCATCLGAIPVLEQVLGVPYEIAWTMVILNGFLYTLHATLGDPVVPGWISQSIPLTIAFLTNGYVQGPERTQALIALQLLVGLMFIFMGATGFAGKIINRIPVSLKAGIVLGAGFGSILEEFTIGARVGTYPIAIGLGGIIAYLMLFSDKFKILKEKNKFWKAFGNYGMLPAIIVALIVGPMIGEIATPQPEIGTFIKIPNFVEMVRLVSPFSIGFPSIKVFIEALPLAFMIYIMSVGDFVTSGSLIAEGDEIREDEVIDFNADRSNLISGTRNIIMALFAPYVTLCGPLWDSVTAAVAERYKDGREAMDSIFSGMGTFRWMTFIAVTIIPVVTLVKPVLPIALSMTLLVQGFVCIRIGMELAESDLEKGIAGVIGAVICARGAAWGLGVGILLHFLLGSKMNREIKKEAVNF